MSLVFLLFLFCLATLGHGYLWTDAVNRLHAWWGPRKLIDFLSLSCFLAFLVLPIAVGMRWGDLELLNLGSAHGPFRWPHYYFFCCAVWGGFALARNSWHRYATDDARVLLSQKQEVVSANAQMGADLFREGFPRMLSKVPGNQILRLTVDKKRLAIPRLSPQHEGLQIAHISDLHMTGRIGQQWYEFVVEQVNQLNADAIILTGDIIENESCWPWLADSIGKLRAKYGVYFILGNHDFYIDTKRTTQLLQEQGLVCLSQRWTEVDWNGAPVLLAGNELPWAPRAADMSTAPAGDEEELPLRLMLLHSPDQFSWACEQDAHLALAGHTHGGQLRFPLLGPIVSPSRYGTRYACGVFQQDKTVMHVSRGIAGKTPLRWNCPPEIALLELLRA